MVWPYRILNKSKHAAWHGLGLSLDLNIAWLNLGAAWPKSKLKLDVMWHIWFKHRYHIA
jgi:hypothetical protein